MQQVKFKDRSMEAARYGIDRDYYLFAIKGDRAVIKYVESNVWRSRTVSLAALEVATPLCVLPSTPILNVSPVDIPPGHVEGLARAFWRRIEPYKNDYDKELPDVLPIEFRAHMTTALLVLDQ